MKKIYKTFSFKVFACFVLVNLCSVVMVGTAAGRISSRTMRDNNYATASGLLQQVKYFCDSKFSEMQEILDVMTTGTSYLHLLKKDYYSERSAAFYLDVTEVLENMQEMKKNYNEIIDSIYYYNERLKLELYVNNGEPVTRIDGSSVLDKIQETGILSVGWIPVHEETIFQTISPRRVITLYRYTAGTFFCINLNLDIFQEELDCSVFGENCYLALMNGEVMLTSFSGEKDYMLQSLDEIQSGENGWQNTYSVTGKMLWATGVKLDSNDWFVAAVMPEDYLKTEVHQIYKAVLAWAVFILFVVSCLAFFVSKSVTGPVSFLIRQMQKVQEDSLEVDFSLKDKESELGIMAQNLNQMECRMVGLIEQAKEQERVRQKMEIAVLQAQINPHFLYNTLNSAQGLVREGENDRAEYLLGMLTVFFRTGLGRGRDKVSLKEELRHAKSYLEIQRMRYADCFSYEIETEEGVEDAEVIRVSLQPLIENAIQHGLRESREGKVVLISAGKEGHNLKICVFDDGAGMSRKRLEEVRSEIDRPFEDGDSVVTYGLRNVNQRLILEYGKEYGLELSSVEGEYTMVTMCLPYR